jgi:histone H3/H4
LIIGDIMPQDLVKKSGIKDEADEYNVSKEFYDSLDRRVKQIIQRAKERSQENRRQTLKPQDI